MGKKGSLTQGNTVHIELDYIYCSMVTSRDGFAPPSTEDFFWLKMILQLLPPWNVVVETSSDKTSLNLASSKWNLPNWIRKRLEPEVKS